MIEKREQEHDRAEHHETEDLFERLHPQPGLGEKLHEPGDEPDKDVGERHAGGDRPEHAVGHVRRLREGEAEHWPEERPAAGGSQHRAQHPLEEGPERSLLRLQMPRLLPDEAGDRQLPHAQERQREGEHDRRHRDVEGGRRELLAPGEVAAPEADVRRHARRGQREKHGVDAGAIPEIGAKDFGPRLPRLLRERHQFQAEDGEHTGHEIQNQPPEEPGKKRHREGERGLRNVAR